MNGKLRVIQPGILSTVQDAGRAGYRRLGVPVSGALDRTAYLLANRLAGNPDDSAAVEMLYRGTHVECVDAPVTLVAAGAGAALIRADGSKVHVPAWHAVRIMPGEQVRMAAITNAATAYLAVRGGFAAHSVMHSAATYARGNLGGHDGRPLQPGDVLEVRSADDQVRRPGRLPEGFELPAPQTLRVIADEGRRDFSTGTMTAFFADAYAVTPQSDRTGLRLAGTQLAHEQGYDLLSEGVATGAIQVPGSGQPILLLGDHPTVGGYPKIGTVISADLPSAGRLRIGSEVRFQQVGLEDARRARLEYEARLQAWTAAIQPVDF